MDSCQPNKIYTYGLFILFFHLYLDIILIFFLWLKESQCSAEFEWHTEVICAKHANSQDLDRQKVPSSGIVLVSSSHSKHGNTFYQITVDTEFGKTDWGKW